MILRGLLALAALAIPLAAAALPADAEKLIVGGWSCTSNCFDEEYAFNLEDGERRFNTYTHARPSISMATWKLEGSRLTIVERDSTNVLYDFRVLQVTGKRLVLRDNESPGARPVILKRIEEKPRKAAPPPK